MGEEPRVLVGLLESPSELPAGTASAMKESPEPEKETTTLEPRCLADTSVGVLGPEGGGEGALDLEPVSEEGVLESPLLLASPLLFRPEKSGKLNWSIFLSAPASTLPGSQKGKHHYHRIGNVQGHPGSAMAPCSPCQESSMSLPRRPKTGTTSSNP